MKQKHACNNSNWRTGSLHRDGESGDGRDMSRDAAMEGGLPRFCSGSHWEGREVWGTQWRGGVTIYSLSPTSTSMSLTEEPAPVTSNVAGSALAGIQ